MKLLTVSSCRNWKEEIPALEGWPQCEAHWSCIPFIVLEARNRSKSIYPNYILENSLVALDSRDQLFQLRNLLLGHQEWPHAPDPLGKH